jgi:hypothetical protein
MKPQRTWNPAGADKENAEIELLYLELAAFNQRIGDLEKLHPDGPKIEILKADRFAVGGFAEAKRITTNHPSLCARRPSRAPALWSRTSQGLGRAVPSHAGQRAFAKLAVKQADDECQHDRTSSFDRGP